MLFEPRPKLLTDNGFNDRPHLRGHKLVFRLRAEFGIRHFHRHDRRQSFPRIIAGEAHLLTLQKSRTRRIAVHHTGQRCAETGEVRATIPLGNVVREKKNLLVVAIVPPHRDLNRDAVLLRRHGDRVADQSLLGSIKVTNELG